MDNKNISKQHSIIHRYLVKTYTNPQPPGFADFLRGTMALYQIANKHNYHLKIDVETHPIFKFLDIPEEYKINLDPTLSTIEITPPIGYDQMESIIESYLKNENDVYFLTNAFYKENKDLTNEYDFMKTVFKPNNLLHNYIESIKTELKLINKEYIIIHARVGDAFLVYGQTINFILVDRIRNYIKNIIKNTNKQVLFIADSYQLKEYVKDLCKITGINPIHTGSLDNTEVDNRILATLAEFFIMSNATDIYCINFWDGSGYSRICSRIYSINYHCLQL